MPLTFLRVPYYLWKTPSVSPDHASTCSSWSPPPVWCTRPQHSREFDDGSPQSLRTPCHSSYCCPRVWPVRHPPATSLEPAASVLAESGLTCAQSVSIAQLLTLREPAMPQSLHLLPPLIPIQESPLGYAQRISVTDWPVPALGRAGRERAQRKPRRVV